MANQLKMAVVHAILTLKQLGWSQRRIAEELGLEIRRRGAILVLERAGAIASHRQMGNVG